jgi:hypothetical protein
MKKISILMSNYIPKFNVDYAMSSIKTAPIDPSVEREFLRKDYKVLFESMRWKELGLPIDIFDMICEYLYPWSCYNCSNFIGKDLLLCDNCINKKIELDKINIITTLELYKFTKNNIETLSTAFLSKKFLPNEDKHAKRINDEYQQIIINHNNQINEKITKITQEMIIYKCQYERYNIYKSFKNKYDDTELLINYSKAEEKYKELYYNYQFLKSMIKPFQIDGIDQYGNVIISKLRSILYCKNACIFHIRCYVDKMRAINLKYKNDNFIISTANEFELLELHT